jgi:hypothetical protein
MLVSRLGHIEKNSRSEVKEGIRYTTDQWIMETHGPEVFEFFKRNMFGRTCMLIEETPKIVRGIYWWDYEFIVDQWNNNINKRNWNGGR